MGEDHFPYIVQIISGVIIALTTFLLTLITFRIQQKWKDKSEKKIIEKIKFDLLIVILSEIKRALDRCGSLLKKLQEGTKSYSNLYLKLEENIFPVFLKFLINTK